MVEITVPPSKAGGELMQFSFTTDGEAEPNSVEILIPYGLAEGDTFTIADPARFVTVGDLQARVRSKSCRCFAVCDPHDQISCCEKEATCLQRFILAASSCYCCGAMLVLFFLMSLAMAGTILQIIEDGGEWPTVSIQGDLDPSNLLTLQGWAFDEFESEARSSVSDYLAMRDGTFGQDEDNGTDTDDIQQTEINGKWTLNIVFRVRGELGDPSRNLLTADGLSFMKDVQEQLLDVRTADDERGFEDVCLRIAANSSLLFAPDITNETELECALPTSPLKQYYPLTTTDNSYTMFGDPFYDTLEDPGLMDILDTVFLFGLVTSVTNFTANFTFNVTNATNFTDFNFTNFNFTNFTDFNGTFFNNTNGTNFTEAAEDFFEDLFEDFENGNVNTTPINNGLLDILEDFEFDGENGTNASRIRTANVETLVEQYTLDRANATTLQFNGKGNVLAPCGIDTSLLPYVAEQGENFLCILDPLTALDADDVSDIAEDVQFLDYYLTAEEADDIGWPYSHVFENVTSGRPAGFCNQCYSLSCYCNQSLLANEAMDTNESVQMRIDTISEIFAVCLRSVRAMRVFVVWF